MGADLPLELADVVLVDLRGTEPPDVPGALRRLQDTPAVALVDTDVAPRTLIDLTMSGFRGIVADRSSRATLAHAITAVAEGRSYVDPTLTSQVAVLALRGRRSGASAGLTLAQMRVLRLLPEGLPDDEIGQRLGLSHETVRSHVRAIATALGAKNRREAVCLAMRRGLLDPTAPTETVA